MFLSILDSAGVPIIGGVDLLLVSYSADHPANAWFAAICAIAGSLGGSAILFAIARKGGEVFLAKYIATGSGKRLHAWFEQYGLITVFVPAISPLPLPLKVPVFCSGALGVRWTSFLGVLLAARTIRYFALAALGREFGRSTFAFLASHLVVVFGIAVGLGVAAVIVLRLIRHKGPHGHHPTASNQTQ
ncbi:MAG TPA: VTT domain-containing protein [Bryobacteraceae bacterium]